MTREEAAEHCHLDGEFAFILETDGYSAFSDDVSLPVLAPADLNDYRIGNATYGYRPEKGPQPVFYAKGPAFREGAVMERANLVDIAPTLACALGMDLQETEGRVQTELLA